MRRFLIILSIIIPSPCYAEGLLSNLFNTCDQYCQNRKENEQARQQFLDEQEGRKERRKIRIAEFEKTPLGQAYDKSLQSMKTIENGKEYEGQEVYILGGVNCDTNHLCWIAPQWNNPSTMLDYSHQVMWFDPSQLDDNSINTLMLCPNALACFSIIKGNLYKKYVEIDGKRVKLEGVYAKNPSYINILPIINAVFDN